MLHIIVCHKSQQKAYVGMRSGDQGDQPNGLNFFNSRTSEVRAQRAPGPHNRPWDGVLGYRNKFIHTDVGRLYFGRVAPDDRTSLFTG
jgi:hypothetical protein